MVKYLGALLCALVVVTQASAGGPCYSCNRSCETVYQQPIIQQIISPEIAFVPAQVSYGNQVVIYDPAAVTASGLGYSYQAAPEADGIQALNQKMDLILRAMYPNGVGQQGQPAAQPAGDVVDPTPVKAQSQPIPPPAKPSQPTTGWQQRTPAPMPTQVSTHQSNTGVGWKAVLQQNCIKCHGNDSHNGLSMIDDKGQILAKLPRLKIYDRVTLPVTDEHHMPKKGPALPPDQIEALRQWARDGLADLDY